MCEGSVKHFGCTAPHPSRRVQQTSFHLPISLSPSQAWATSISGYPALIWPMRATTFGWPPGVPSPLPTGMLGNPIISATRTGRRRTAWNCGIAMAKDSNGTIPPAALRRISCARCSPSKARPHHPYATSHIPHITTYV